MQLTIAKKQLVWLATTCLGVTDKKSAMPILSHVKLDADSRLRMSASNMQMSVTVSADAEVAKPGSVAIDARDLLERVKAMPDGPVRLTVSANQSITLQAPGAQRRFTMMGLSASDFPPFDEPKENAQRLELSTAMLEQLIGAVHAGISTDETRAHVNSALLEWNGDQVALTSTDGHRLHHIQRTIEGSNAAMSALIPLRAVNELQKLASATQVEQVELTISGSVAFWQFGDIRFHTRLVEAQFPPYQHVIPKSTDSTVLVAKAELASAIEAVRVAAGNGGLTLSFGPDKLTIEARSPDAGEGQDEVIVEYSGKPVKIGASGRYMLDALRAIDGDEATLGFTGELDPIVVKAVDEGERFLAVVMPMRV